MEHLPQIVTAVSSADDTNKSPQHTDRTNTLASPHPSNLPSIVIEKEKLGSRQKLLENGQPKIHGKSSSRSKKRSKKGKSPHETASSATDDVRDDESVSSIDSGASGSSSGSSYYSESGKVGQDSRKVPPASPSSAAQPTKQKAPSKLKALHKETISKTASLTTLNILGAATTSVKALGIKKHLEADLAGNGRHVLLTKGATIPHIHLTVDATTAHEIATLATRDPVKPVFARTNTVNGASRLLHCGVPAEYLHDVEEYVEHDSTPGFARKTVHVLLNEAAHHTLSLNDTTHHHHVVDAVHHGHVEAVQQHTHSAVPHHNSHMGLDRVPSHL